MTLILTRKTVLQQLLSSIMMVVLVKVRLKEILNLEKKEIKAKETMVMTSWLKFVV